MASSYFRTAILFTIIALISISSFYRYSNELYGYTLIFTAILILSGMGIGFSGKRDVYGFFSSNKLLGVVYLLTLAWLICLALPMPIDLVSLVSTDSANIRRVWVPKVENATISLFPYRMLEPIITFITVIFLFIACFLLSTTSQVKIIPVAISAIAIVQGSLAIYSAITHQQFIDTKLFDGHFNHGRGTFVNKNLFAAFMWFPFCYAISNIWERAQSLGATSISAFFSLKQFHSTVGIWYLLLTFSVIAMLSSYSAGAFVVLIILAITIFITFADSPVDFVRKYSIWIFIAFAMGISILIFQPGGVQRFEGIFGARATIWNRSVDLLKLYWLSGIGGDGLNEIFDMVNDWIFMDYRANTAHTYILDQWIKFGFIYVLGIGLMWYIVYRRIIAGENVIWRQIDFEGRVFIRFAVLVGYCLLLHSVISPVFYYVAIHFSFLCVLAAACKVVVLSKSKRSSHWLRG